ncbi:MAG: 1-deoxy-D-xylulose-5-phosphate reductoisomerase [Bacillota bacterium]
MLQQVAILGSTGSIGTQALKIIQQFPDRFSVCALATGSNITLLEEQIRNFKPEIVSVFNEDQAVTLRRRVADLPVKVLTGAKGLVELSAWPGVDVVIVAVVGFSGVMPTLSAIRAGKKVALANKETLVVAGEIVMAEARRHNTVILPIDSEHSAIFQCFHAGGSGELKRVILTASGGPFLGKKREELAAVTPEQALRHPNWRMGPRISIDSATLMNKGFEVIEACRLFALETSQVQVVIHPESIVHSMVEFIDGSIVAQLGLPDMLLPIQYALSYPQRWPNPFPRFDWDRNHTLHFYPAAKGEYPCLDLAYQALQVGGTLPAVLNGADEIAVRSFLEGRITLMQIPALLAEVMSRHEVIQHPSLEDIVEADCWARKETERII